jgi:tetratricopeptide (TPR) repeat protein
MSRDRFRWFSLGAFIAVALLLLLAQIPTVKFHLEWRLDALSGIVRGWLRPEETLPIPLGLESIIDPPSILENKIPTRIVRPTLSLDEPTPTAIPRVVQLESPGWEKQDWNNCGPATLALGLRYFGWEGDQFDISDLLKPDRGDKNVNIEEMIYYVKNRAGWLDADFRVGGSMEDLQRFIAAGIPVIVEKGFTLDDNDGGGGWAGHYLLLTGYDLDRQIFMAQDTNPSTGGPDREISFTELDEEWRAFNRVYLFIYRPERKEEVEALLEENLDTDLNRQLALESAWNEIEATPEDAYAWFNYGSNLVYFERYGAAAQAFDTALTIGLPWRFTRYQFGPYIAYFHQGRFQDVIDLADATLFRTNKSEESLLWRGWAKFRIGEINSAIDDFREALEYNPNYIDAQYALEYLGVGP